MFRSPRTPLHKDDKRVSVAVIVHGRLKLQPNSVDCSSCAPQPMTSFRRMLLFLWKRICGAYSKNVRLGVGMLNFLVRHWCLQRLKISRKRLSR